ncbi:hypothetical protein J19TS2_61270 [Cohnella xylanilytica]|nr:hypothetical protein J19TS2_61270 [Cohnella xylanilytica]
MTDGGFRRIRQLASIAVAFQIRISPCSFASPLFSGFASIVRTIQLILRWNNVDSIYSEYTFFPV